MNNPTDNITLGGTQQLRLQLGHYRVSCSVSAILKIPGYLQITPVSGGPARIDPDTYFHASGSSSIVDGAHTFTFYASEATSFSLTYNSNVSGRSVQTTLDIEKLNHASG